MRGKARVRVARLEGGRWREVRDEVAAEAPLEIRLRYRDEVASLGVVLRTPGQDAELAAGLLYTEDLLGGLEEALPDLGKLGLSPPPPLAVDPDLLLALPERLGEAQRLFRATGGLHAAALFDREGRLVALREDVGRHNALDKLIGWAFLQGKLPLHDHILLVSGRAGYELLVKAVAAGIPVFCAVSAPTSLAVALAQAYGLTLVGFLRPGRMNVYAGRERVGPPRGLPNPCG